VRIVASGWLIYLKCMIMHGLANFKFKDNVLSLHAIKAHEVA
jgi:hypothetical protein